MKIKFLDLAYQYQRIKPEIDIAISEVLNHAAFVGGSHVSNFEASFAEFCGAKHCIGVGNGTDALEIGLEGLDLPSDSEVLVPANSFIASSEAVTRTGLKVVFCDIDPETYLIDFADAQQKITPATRALIMVHLYGNASGIREAKDFCDRNNLLLIEDCAQVHGGQNDGLIAGTAGVFGAFSFYPGKNLGAYGDAGAIITNDQKLADLTRKIANHGRIGKYDHDLEGRNSRLDSLQAAVLNVKLRYLNEFTERRIQVANWYREGLTGLHKIQLPPHPGQREHVYHLYVIQVENRDDLRKYLADRGIETGIHYPVALPDLPAYQSYRQSCPTATRMSARIISLPMGDHLEQAEAAYVCQTIREFLQ